MFRTGNPALNKPEFQSSAQSWSDLEAQGRYSEGTRARAAAKGGRAGHMTIQGAVNKTAFTIALCVATAVLAWNLGVERLPEGFAFNGGLVNLMTWGGMLVGLVLALAIIFVPRLSPFLAPVYAIAEGFFVGGISAFYALIARPQDTVGEGERVGALATDGSVMLAGRGDGGAANAIVDNLNTELIFNAILLTFGIAGGLLAAYSFKLIRPNRTFYNVTITATLGVALYGFVAIIASFFGSYSLASVYDPNNGGLLAIGFSLLCVGLASMNLVLDFDIINNAARNRAPKYMEWYGAFAVLVTLVWLYISLLRLLAQLQSRD